MQRSIHFWQSSFTTSKRSREVQAAQCSGSLHPQAEWAANEDWAEKKMADWSVACVCCAFFLLDRSVVFPTDQPLLFCDGRSRSTISFFQCQSSPSRSSMT